MPSADVDINSFPPTSLHGIELYFGLATVPARYIGLRDSATCGTILLWSRGPDTEFRPEPLANPGDLERLVQRLGAFTAETVDTPARLDNNRALQVPYPPSLFAERRRGRVVAEFVVNPAGRVEPNTIGIVSSTHPLFSQAVRATLQAAAYLPAVKGGRAVFQLVHQAFDFDPIRRDRNE
jgi:TonB family protein